MMRQVSFCCRHCGGLTLLAGGLCRGCYDRARHSRLHFAGCREQVLARDRCCQLCLAEEKLLVHHRRPGAERPALQITLCRRCHTRLHRLLRLPGQYSALFWILWREQHPHLPAQLALRFEAA